MLAPGIPVDLRLAARDARPVQLDLMDVEGDADLRLHGLATDALDATGSVRLSRVEIRLPDRLPPDIAVLEVRERGRATHPNRQALGGRPALISAEALRLDLGLSAPHAIQIRGRGIDAELGGDIRLTGTLARPEATGGFDLLQGQFELVGQTLRFNRGRLGFDGASGLDPTLDLEARVTAAGSTAILQVLGTARTPRIELRGEPELPEDEVLSRILFGVAGGRLSALQAARLGIAAASLAGLETGGGPGLLDQARTGLHLDRLSVDSNESGDATLEGGRHISERVYLGARQGMRAGETQGCCASS
jgi:translocation and assembly module TamB